MLMKLNQGKISTNHMKVWAEDNHQKNKIKLTERAKVQIFKNLAGYAGTELTQVRVRSMHKVKVRTGTHCDTRTDCGLRLK